MVTIPCLQGKIPDYIGRKGNLNLLQGNSFFYKWFSLLQGNHDPGARFFSWRVWRLTVASLRLQRACTMRCLPLPGGVWTLSWSADYSMYSTFLTATAGSVLFTSRSTLLKRKDLCFSCLRLGLISHRRLESQWDPHTFFSSISTICRLQHVFNVSNRLVRIGSV
jgi:hypothetical protein